MVHLAFLEKFLVVCPMGHHPWVGVSREGEGPWGLEGVFYTWGLLVQGICNLEVVWTQEAQA